MKVFAVCFVVAFLAVCWVPGGQAWAADVSNPAAPVLVELFTSEGCSSCPPADALLQRMDSAQPIPGAQLIVLSEHVDYWDHDGWKDPYSLHFLDDRQSAYKDALKLGPEHTPQIIIDGSSELQGNDPEQLKQTFQRAVAAQKVPVRIESLAVDAKTDAKTASVLHARIQIDGSSEKHNADIYVAVALDHAESQVVHGENSGRRLTHVAVVLILTKIGKLEKGKSFDQDVQLKLKVGTDPSNLRVIAFVQSPGPREVLGAALRISDK
jgi:hypothetical protein